MTPHWMTEAKGHSIRQVAEALGLAVHGNRILCPKCGKEKDRSRPTIGLRDDRGWRCHRCGQGGSSLDLAAAVLGVEIRGTRGFFAQYGFCDAATSPIRPLRRSPPRSDPTGQNPYPPQGEVEQLWREGRPIASDRQVSAWLQSRCLDPGCVEERGLARVLPPRPPQWARCWLRDHRVVLPLYDHQGQLRSVRSRRITEGRFKSLNPRHPERPQGKSWGTKGLVFANGAGVALLQSGELEPGAMVYVVEGGPDFLTLSCWLSETCPDVVLGIGSGQWTDELAARIPDGTHVLVLTDRNEAGAGYAEAVARSLEGRCPLQLPDPSWSDARDLNDRWRQDGAEAFDPFAGLTGDEPPIESIPDRSRDEQAPYLCACATGPAGFYVATPSGNYVFVRKELVRVELERMWPGLKTRDQEGNRSDRRCCTSSTVDVPIAWSTPTPRRPASSTGVMRAERCISTSSWTRPPSPCSTPTATSGCDSPSARATRRYWTGSPRSRGWVSRRAPCCSSASTVSGSP